MQFVVSQRFHVDSPRQAHLSTRTSYSFDRAFVMTFQRHGLSTTKMVPKLKIKEITKSLYLSVNIFSAEH